MKVTMKQLVVFQIIYTILIIQWIESFKVISILPLLADGINILILILLSRQHLKTNVKSINRVWIVINIWILVEILLGILQFADNGLIRGVVLLFWSLRMFFRPFLLMAAIEKSFSLEEIIKKIDEFIMPLNIINVILAAIQFYIFRMRWDINGGIFGVRQGCTAYVNLFYCIAVGYCMVQFFNKKRTIYSLMLIISSAIVVGYWSELKFLYFELIIIILLSVIVCKPRLQNVLFVIAAVIILQWGIPKAAEFLPSNFQQMFELEELISYSKNAYNENGIGSVTRGGGLETISDEIFKDNPIKNVIGVGLGGANSVSFGGISSTIYNLHGWRHYDYFSLMYVFVEMGYLGIIFFVAFLVTMLNCYLKIENEVLRAFGIIMIAIVLMNFWYNSSWITDGTVYLMVLFMEIPLLALKIQSKENSV